MMWDATIEAAARRTVQEATATANLNLPVSVDRTPSAVLNLPGAQNAIDTAQSAVDSSIETIRRTTNNVKRAGDSASAESEELRRNIESRQGAVEQAKTTVSEAQVLSGIRQEQSAALKNKYDANYHSSWLGLWRPLSEQSRVGLFISALVFGIVALVSIVYYFWTPVSAMIAKYTSGAIAVSTASSNLFGGGRHRNKK
jgi:hypothetical protein